MNNAVLIARKYAQALLNVVEDFSDAQIEGIGHVVSFFEHHRTVLFVLNSPELSLERKLALMEEIFSAYDVPTVLKDLCALLFEHKRLFLLPEVFRAIYQLAQEQKYQEKATITSSHALTQEAIAAISNFIAHKTKKQIISTHIVDPSLIAGIRVQGATFLWEHSVRKQLHEVKLPLIIKGHYEH